MLVYFHLNEKDPDLLKVAFERVLEEYKQACKLAEPDDPAAPPIYSVIKENSKTKN